MTTTIDEEARRYLHDLAASWLAPDAGECLTCYLHRMLTEFRCDGGLRFVQHYRDARAPRATGLETRLGSSGGFCDCEVMINVYVPVRPARGADDEDDGDDEDAHEQAVLARPCETVRAGSTRPCGKWRRRERGGW